MENFPNQNSSNNQNTDSDDHEATERIDFGEFTKCVSEYMSNLKKVEELKSHIATEMEGIYAGSYGSTDEEQNAAFRKLLDEDVAEFYKLNMEIDKAEELFRRASEEQGGGVGILTETQEVL